jgi:hypothetical protein
MPRILITGSRDWEDGAKLAWELGQACGEMVRANPELTRKEIVVVHGGARGADTMAAELALSRGLSVERHAAEWRPYGIYNPQAGRYRNQKMVDLGADICLAFIRNNSSGASHCAQAAEDAGIPVRIFRY